MKRWSPKSQEEGKLKDVKQLENGPTRTPMESLAFMNECRSSGQMCERAEKKGKMCWL